MSETGQVRVEQFAAERAVNTLNVNILRRIAGLNTVQGDALRFAPLGQPGADECWPDP